MKFIHPWLTLLTLGLLGACAHNGSSTTFDQVLKETADQDGRACLRQRDMRGFGVLKQDVVSLDGRRDYYLATLTPGCHALQTSPGALFEGDFRELCGGRQDKVRTEDEHCTIRHIYRFDDRDSAFEAHRAALERYRAMRDEETEE